MGKRIFNIRFRVFLNLISLFVAVITPLPAFSQEGTINTPVPNDTAPHHAFHRSLRTRENPLPYRYHVTPPVLPDSSDVRYRTKKHFWRGAGEVVGCNILLWSYDRYIRRGDYARISWSSIKENILNGFEWDDDNLTTNMFLHPYHGSLYFNAGRSNGYNFWQSELFAIGGSAMWELLMERAHPSTNDIIATPIGGAALGEVSYRASDLILDNRATGAERVGREIAGFVVDPMRGLNRIFTGRAWQKRPTSGRHFGVPALSIEVALGARMLAMRNKNNRSTRAGAAAELNVEYGNRFEETTKVPYDYFSFLLEVQGMKTQPIINRVEIMGRLFSQEVIDRKDLNVNLGFYQHFDFFDSDSIRQEKPSRVLPCLVPYKLGTPASFGGGAMFRYVPAPALCFDGFLHLNAVVIAGTLTDFYRDYNRNYNWGSGFSIKAGLNWALPNDKVSVKLINHLYRLYTWRGIDYPGNWSMTNQEMPPDMLGDKSNAIFDHFGAVLNYKIWKKLYLTASVDLYHRSTHYFGYVIKLSDTGKILTNPTIRSNQIALRLMFKYKF